MNIKMSIAVFILLSFLNMGAVHNNFVYNKNKFNLLELNLRNISDFEENGVKLQYRTKESIDKEAARIKECLTYGINGEFQDINENEFKIDNRDFDANIKLWNETEFNYVEITLVNKNSKYLIDDLMSILKKLENQKEENVQYFTYYEGKELDDNYSTDKFIEVNGLQRTKVLKISNGYTGTGYLKDGEKVNFALVEYNTGSHIIIGTPIIFTTY